MRGDEFHHLKCFFGSYSRETQHRISTNQYQTFGVPLVLRQIPKELVILLFFGLLNRLRSEYHYIWQVYHTPFPELVLPLFCRNLGCAHNQGWLLDGATRSDSSQGLTSATRQHNDSGPCPLITEHLTQCLLLVVPYLSVRFEFNIQISCLGITLEVIFFNQWIIASNSILLQIIQLLGNDGNSHLLAIFLLLNLFVSQADTILSINLHPFDLFIFGIVDLHHVLEFFI